MPSAPNFTASNLTATADLTVEGNFATVGGSSTKFATNAPALFGSTLGVTGAATLSSTLAVTGSTTLTGALMLTGLQGSFVDAAAAASYSTVASTTGTIDVTGKQVILLDFSAFNGTTRPIDTLKLPVAVSGQVVIFVVKIGASGGTHTMVKTNTANIIGSTVMHFGADYGTFEALGLGAVWLIRCLQGVTIS